MTYRIIGNTTRSIIAAGFLAGSPALAQDGGPSGAFQYSDTPEVAAEQTEAKAVVQRYQEGLNNSNFAAIRNEFASDAIAEWNDKETVVGVADMKAPYDKLFEDVAFSTDFQFDAVDIHGDIAIIRTHHPVGQAEVSVKDGTDTLDFNREIFVLNRIDGDWKIILYTFNTQPKQGEQ